LRSSNASASASVFLIVRIIVVTYRFPDNPAHHA
jgi:hypothetical protein